MVTSAPVCSHFHRALSERVAQRETSRLRRPAPKTRVVPLLRNAPGGRLQAFVLIHLRDGKKEGGSDGKRDEAVKRGRSFPELARVSGVVAQGCRTRRLSTEDRFHSKLGHFLERCSTPSPSYPACLRSYPAAEDAIREEPQTAGTRQGNALGERCGAAVVSGGGGTLSGAIVL